VSRPSSGRNEALASFLRDRRGRVEPERVGLPAGRRRRVPGLRREEVARLAGLSVDYYARLEQGRQQTASPGVLGSVARTLRLSDDERQHLFDLAKVADRTPAPTSTDGGEERVRQLLTALGDTPALALGPFVDIVHANTSAKYLFADFDALPPPHRNGVRWMMLAPRARDLHGDDWADAAAELVGLLRLHAGQNPDSARLTEITDELSALSPLFNQLWREQTVSTWQHREKTLRHPDLGEMSFANEFLTVQSAPQLSVVVMVPADPERFSAALAASLT